MVEEIWRHVVLDPFYAEAAALWVLHALGMRMPILPETAYSLTCPRVWEVHAHGDHRGIL
jgi:hypothetical protein